MKMFFLLFLAAPLACTTTEPELPDISGAWTFSMIIANQSISWSCEGRGRFNFSQTDTTLTGSYALSYANCATPAGPISLSLIGGPINNGVVSGRTVTFTDNKSCDYQGEVSGNPAEEIAGNASCPIVTTGEVVSFTGTWRAVREP